MQMGAGGETLQAGKGMSGWGSASISSQGLIQWIKTSGDRWRWRRRKRIREGGGGDKSNKTGHVTAAVFNWQLMEKPQREKE